MNEATKKYLTFTLDGEFFALDIATVREVQDMTSITRIPQAAAHMRGVVNLRGNAVPVLDIKMKFGMSCTEQTIHTRIIIMERRHASGDSLMGVLADSVKEVLEIDDKDIEPPPRMGAALKADYIIGVAKKQDRFIILLDMHKVLDADEAGLDTVQLTAQGLGQESEQKPEQEPEQESEQESEQATSQ